MFKYSSVRWYLPLLCLFGGMAMVCAVLLFLRWEDPQRFESGKIIKVVYDYGDFVKTTRQRVGTIDPPEERGKTGYTLVGWYYLLEADTGEYFTDENGEAMTEIEKEWDFRHSVATDDITVYAKWKPNPYTLTLDANGGYCSKERLTVYYEQPFTLPVPSRNGYYFAGWYGEVRHERVANGVWDQCEDMQLTAMWATCPYGKRVTFGAWEQDNDLKNGQEPIEWIVIGETNGRYMLISKYILAVSQYDPSPVNDWSKSVLRKWLNESFFNAAFSISERAHISQTELADVGCSDYVFVLSLDEANGLILDYRDAYGLPTVYATANGHLISSHTGDGEKTSYGWILRDEHPKGSSEKNLYSHALGWYSGHISNYYAGASNTASGGGIRPVIWVDKDAVENK